MDMFGLMETLLTDMENILAEFTLKSLRYSIKIFSHLKLCLSTATHNFKLQEMYVIL